MTSPGAVPFSRDALLARLPERARTIEARAMALENRCETRGGGSPEEPLLVVETSGGGLAVLVGPPEPTLLAAASADPKVVTILVEPEHAESAHRALPGWQMERARLHELPLSEAEAMPADEPGVRMLSKDDLPGLAHLPDALREEILRVFGRAHVAAAFEGGVAVSIAYSVETESLWDVSIDTLEAYRGRGLAAKTTRWLIGHMARHGKRPIWGAVESNAASLALARRLSFRRVDEILVFERPGA